jgi:exodeoxyribonuclease VII small subunit
MTRDSKQDAVQQDMAARTTAQLQSELDEMLSWFESGNMDIDEAVVKYEQGLTLIAEIEKRLKAAENTVKKLAVSFEKAETD